MRDILRMTVLATTVFGVAGNTLAEDWKLAKDEDDMKVYLSSVQGSKYKAYRDITNIKADVAAIEALQEDVKGSCKWVHACAEIKLLKQKGADTWTYSEIDTLWPVISRGVIIHVATEKTADGTVIRHLKTDPTYIPKEKGQIRAPKLVGEWELQPKGQDVTEVTYQVETGPGDNIPSWLANSFMADALLNTLRGLHSAAEKR